MRTLSNLMAATACVLVQLPISAYAGGPSPGSPSAAAVGKLPPAVLPAPGSAFEGRRTFLKLNCYGCHGTFAAGGMGPNIVHAESGDVSEAVRQGEEGGMPSFASYLSPKDIADLSAYLRSIGTPAEPKFMDWWVRVPTK